MRFKKRYVPLILLAGIFGLSRLDFLSFRTSEIEQKKYLLEHGQEEPTFASFESGNQKLHCIHVGNDSLPLVVLVHGSPGSSNAFLDYLSDTTLTKVAQVVAVDRPGYGYSNYGETEPSLKKQAAVLKGILEKYHRKNAILLGHSFGAPVIARMAMDFPDLVSGLVIVAGSIDPDLEPREWWRKPLNWFLVRWILPKSLRVCNQEILPLYTELEKMLPLWKKITCPVTVIQGEKDDLVPRGNADFAEKMLVNSEKVDVQIIEGGNHFVLWSLRKEIIAKIIELENRDE